MRVDYILTIDAGTSAFKIMLWDESSSNTASYCEELTLVTDERGFIEFPVESYWDVVARGVKRIIHDYDINPQDIRVAVISSQGETLINLDKHGDPLRRAIVWIDNRSTDEATIIEKEFGRDQVFRISGQPEIVPTWPATKVLWQRRMEPDVFKTTAKFLMLEDYLIYKLTGKFVGEFSMHSSTLWLDINGRRLWREMIEFLGVEPRHFPEIVDSGEAVGNICSEAAEYTGLDSSTLVVTGALDQAASAIGAGNIGPGICSETTGSALAACMFIDEPAVSTQYRVPCHCHALKEKYYLMAWGQTAGVALKWFKDNFCPEEASAAQAQGRNVYEVIDDAARDVPAGSDGLVFLPHLAGAACPEFNPQARGVYFGITLNHKRAHFARSIMESVAYMLKRNVELLENMGLAVRELRSVGGASRSGLWSRIKSDVVGKPVRQVLFAEAASAGVAAIGGVATGMFRNTEEGCAAIVKLGERLLPARENQQAYCEGYRTYVQIYERLLPLFGPSAGGD